MDQVHQTLGCHLVNTFAMTENCSNVTGTHSGYDPDGSHTTIGKPTCSRDARVVEFDSSDNGTVTVVAERGSGQLVAKKPQIVQVLTTPFSLRETRTVRSSQEMWSVLDRPVKCRLPTVPTPRS